MLKETFLSFIQGYGYYAVFTLLMIGMVGILPVPEETSMVFIGFLVAKGDLKLGWCILLAFLGTTSGMTIAYYLGWHVGAPLVQRYGIKIGFTRKRMAMAERWFKTYGKWTLAIGYFIPGLRQITAYTAGISRLPLRSFIWPAYLGAAVWTTGFISLGAYLGSRVEILKPLINRYIIWLFAAVLVFTIIYALARSKRTEKDVVWTDAGDAKDLKEEQ